MTRHDLGQGRELRRQTPVPGESARFIPADFAPVIEHLPDGCPIAGGQAVAWWAERYGLSGENQQPITSADIDFWGTRQDLIALARALKRKPLFPHEYEMTVWAGAVPIEIRGTKTLAEFLHTIPGLDIVDPDKASVEQNYQASTVSKTVQILSPVSLVMAKLHALRHFSQKDRHDELHLRVSLQSSRHFLAELLNVGRIRDVLWNSERLIAVHLMKPYRRMEREIRFNILEGIPVDAIQRASEDPNQPDQVRHKLSRFIEVRWEKVRRRDSEPGAA